MAKSFSHPRILPQRGGLRLSDQQRKAATIWYNWYAGGGAPALVDFSGLSNLELIIDSTGLVTGETNDFGVVGAGGNPTSLKSLSPGPTGRDFAVNGTAAGVFLKNKAIFFDGLARFRHATSSVWNFLSFNNNIDNLKWTFHALIRFGYQSRPDIAGGIIGNAGNTAANKGVHVMLDDRAFVPRKGRVDCKIFRGQGSTFVANQVTDDNAFIPNVWHVLSVETDCSLDGNDRQKIYIDGQFVASTGGQNSDSPATGPTYNLDIGSAGNAVQNFVGGMSHVIVQSGAPSETDRNEIVNRLLPWRNYFNNVAADTKDWMVNAKLTYNVYDTLGEGGEQNYFNYGMEQNPLNRDVIVQVFMDGDKHALSIGKKLCMRKSTDRRRTFGSQSDIYAPTETGVQGACSGYDSNGRLHVFVDSHIPSPHEAFSFYLYSDDDGATWSEPQPMNDLMPDDGNNLDFRFQNRVIQHKGFLYAPFHKGTFNDGGNSICYFKKPLNGGQWEPVVVSSSPQSVFISEPCIASDGQNLYIISRNESTKEFSFTKSSDDGETWEAQSDLTLGETFTVAGPGFLTSFMMEGVRVLAFYYPDRGTTKKLKVVYGLASNIAANGVSGFDLDTKTELYSGNQQIHYGNFCHYNDNFNAIGSMALEPNPFTGTENTLITFDVTSTNYHTIKAALGL